MIELNCIVGRALRRHMHDGSMNSEDSCDIKNEMTRKTERRLIVREGWARWLLRHRRGDYRSWRGYTTPTAPR